MRGMRMRFRVAILLVLSLLVAPLDAMRREQFAGAIYADNLPTGEYAYSRINGGAVVTHQGSIAVPVAMMFNRITTAGGFRIAAKSQDPGTVYVWAGSWADTGRNSHGVQGHAWNPDGSLAVIDAGGEQESQGLRFYDPSLPAAIANLDLLGRTPGWVTGSPSYGPTSPLSQFLGITRLYAWTKLGEVTVGQGGDGGAVIQYRGQHYLLEPGDTQFIQFHRSGSQLAVAISKLMEQSVVLYWLDESEIASLPAYGSITPPVVAPDPPVVVPDPPVVTPPQDVDNDAAKRIVERERERFGAMSPEQQATLLRNIAKALNSEGVRGGPFGVLIKTSGSNCLGISCDIVCTGNGDKQRQWDVIVGNEAQSAVWHEVDGITQRVCEVPSGPIVTPTDPVDPPAVDVAALKARIAQLEASLLALQREVADSRTQQGIAEQERDTARSERERALAERDELQRRLDSVRCEAKAPKWLGIGCRVIR